ncbi:kinase-like domain-containing protein [Blakeslea trispora]|nr:kinase-like domain-containing protein [Blakeslea trispora]
MPISPPKTPKEEELTVSARMLMHHPLDPAFTEKYVLGQELGSGGFGFVVVAHERQTGIERAVKFIIRKKVPSSAWVMDAEMGRIPMEIYTLHDVFFYLVMELHGHQWNHPNSPLLRSPDLSHTSQSTIEDEDDFTPFVRRTSCDLFECIEQHKRFEEPLAKLIFKQIVACVAYMDRVDENIVIDQDYRVKLIDFGSSVLIPRDHAYFSRFYGTVSFASPEILMAQPYRAEPAEIWSLGVLLFTLLFGEIPFPDAKAALDGRRMKPKFSVSHECNHLMDCLLRKNPEHRLTIHEVLKHPWLC